MHSPPADRFTRVRGPVGSVCGAASKRDSRVWDVVTFPIHVYELKCSLIECHAISVSVDGANCLTGKSPVNFFF